MCSYLCEGEEEVEEVSVRHSGEQLHSVQGSEGEKGHLNSSSSSSSLLTTSLPLVPSSHPSLLPPPSSLLPSFLLSLPPFLLPSILSYLLPPLLSPSPQCQAEVTRIPVADFEVFAGIERSRIDVKNPMPTRYVVGSMR